MSDIKSILNALVNIITEEAEVNPQFRRKLEGALAGLALPQEEDLKTIYQKKGESALRKAVADLKGKSLDAELKKYGIKGLSKLNAAEKRKKLIEYITSDTSAETAAVAEAPAAVDTADVVDAVAEVDDADTAIASIAAEAAVVDKAIADAVTVVAESNAETKSENRVELKHGPNDESQLIDPVAVYHEEGKEELIRKLEKYGTDSLKKIIKSFHLDSRGKSSRVKDKQKLIELIVDKIEARLTKGNVFLEVD